MLNDKIEKLKLKKDKKKTRVNWVNPSNQRLES
jgi:hypothetical protein